MKNIIYRNWVMLSLGLAGTLMGIQGCNCDIQCGRVYLDIGFVGYDTLTLDTVIVRRFDKTNSGDRLKDTILLASPEQIRYRYKGDTALPSSGTNLDKFPFFGLQSDWNYEVFIPAAGKTFQVTDIVEEQRSMKEPCYSPTMIKRICINSIVNISIDNRPASVKDFNTIYLSK